MPSSTNQQPPKYILEAIVDGAPVVVGYDDRPTMETVKNTFGEGIHILHNGEGKELKRFHVTTNRNGNLRIVGETPVGLEAISTLNLHRLVKQYIRIVKVWPAKVNDAKALQKELNRRDTLIEDAIENADANLARLTDEVEAAEQLSDEINAELAKAVAESKAARVKASA